MSGYCWGNCSIGVVLAAVTGAWRGALSGVWAGSCPSIDESCSDDMTPVSVRNSSSYIAVCQIRFETRSEG